MKNRQNSYRKIIYLYLIFVLFFSCGGKKDNKNFKSLAALILQSDSASSNSKNQSDLPKVQPELPKVQPVAKLEIKDPLYKDQWYLKNTGQDGGTAGVDIDIEPIWKQGYTGKGVNVAILDSSVNLTSGEIHEDLKENLDLDKSYNASDGDDSPHGTSVAGIILAKDNDLGIRGIAFRSRLYFYGVLGDGNDPSEIPALTKNITETAVFNNSWGLHRSYGDPRYISAIEKGLKDGFYGKGTVYTFAAGNNPNINISAMYITNSYGVIAVNSLDNDGKHNKLLFFNNPVFL